MSEIKLDLTYLMDAGIGSAGLSMAELGEAEEMARRAWESTRALHDSREVGFFALAEDRLLATRALEYARRLPSVIENFVVLGIGGSSLGAKALYSALARPFDQIRPHVPGLPRRLFFADNIDPVSFSALLELCPLEKTVWNVVTKSGTTPETSAQLLIVLERLRDALGHDEFRKHLVVTTDPEKGALRKLANELDLEAFEVPPAVGGRFSVLSAVGLLPAAVAGLDVQGLLDGARDMAARVLERPQLFENPSLLLASMLFLHDRRRHRRIHVLMPYCDALYDTAEWFRQLWAESLGKRNDTGPTPIAGRGATDQHSQLQLFVEGPDDKVVLFLSVRERGVELPIPQAGASLGDLGYLAGHGLGELLEAERRGTQMALARAGRPTGVIRLERADARALGELIMLLEAATALAGPLYGVNPFDQPGVEEGKRLTFGLLGRSGFERYAAWAEAKHDERFVL